ncbi:glutaminase family protein [Paenibacillus arenilitoris]|uniref:DUF4965 domain-containing protein n=1 Tax=Paenibacillus arenilitoris TaxID=2772299 RepID=A0A927CJN0_9BACL|nr:glutaminase family protein [Paenibacillus arenilitoris]MBD2867833.1 DUF4965 domain-containing protein [Paenibacillus arenilitoris]
MSSAFRPPSVPLITVDPYFSVWSAADRLYDDHTVHWTNKRNSMAGLIRIDGVASVFMGKAELDGRGGEPPETMRQIRVQVDPLTTRYVMEKNGVELTADFTTPLLPDDLDLLSRPVTYVSFRVRSVDGKPHDVQLYVDMSAELCVHTTDQTVAWSRDKLRGGLTAMRIGTVEQPILQRTGDDTRIDWGYCYLAVPQENGVQTAIQPSDVRRRFADTGQLPPKDDERQPRAAADETPVMAAAIDFGRVDAEPRSRFVMAAYDDIRSIEYFGEPLEAYWRRNGMSFEEMLAAAAEQYGDILERCEAFNRELKRDSEAAGGAKYEQLLSLAYRQAVAAHKLVTDGKGNTLFFSKENFSNGCIATVDVSYPSIPLFLRYNPELVKGMMRPIFRYAASEAWVFEFAPHDAGCYPKANGQVYGENARESQMPIEECGNMLIMAAAVCSYEKDARFAEEHWSLLSDWADYLLKHGLDPDNQLCTDDFAGHLAHNANLSVKAILGLGSYSILCGMLGKKEEEARYARAAKENAAQWAEMAGAGDHYKLTFDSASDTWSMKYNLVWDRFFGLELFPKEVVEREISYYSAKQNRYGIPLDSRNTYTKSDWLVWCAALAPTKEGFERMIEPLWLAMHESGNRVPMTDWYDTSTAKQMNFQNRSVVGGLFIKLLKEFA